MNATKKSILVVDDEEIQRSLLVRSFQKYPCRISKAADGAEAIRLLDSTRFDLVLTDLQMGEISGIEVARRAKQRSPKTLVFMMTGCREVEYAIAAFLSGVDDYLLKPFAITALMARLRQQGFVLDQTPRSIAATGPARKQEECQESLQVFGIFPNP